MTNWTALDNAMDYYQTEIENPVIKIGFDFLRFKDWMLGNYGLEFEGSRYVNIIDEKKYMLFLLRFA